MDGVTIGAWITAGAAVISSGYAIYRNGSRGRKQDEVLKAELKAEIKVIKEKLDDRETGLAAIKKDTEDQQLHCAKVSTELATMVTTNKQEIDNLRKKK